MNLETDRLIIREYTINDIELAKTVFSDPTTMSFWPAPFTHEETQKWLQRNLDSYKENGFGRYAVFLKDKNEYIGDCGILKMELDKQIVYDLGYIIYAPFWNKGYSLEAAKAILHFGFTILELKEIYANMPANHKASIRIAEKLGMQRIKEFDNSRNRQILTYIYRLINPQQS